MVNSEIIEIILKAQDQASDTSKKVDDQLKKIGDTARLATQKAVTAEQLHQQKLAQTQATLSQTVSKFNDVGNKGAASFKKLSSSQQDSIVKFNMLDRETQATLQAIHELGVESMDLIPGADSALQKLASMDDRVKTFGGSFDYAKSKMELMGTSTDTLKGKLQVVGNGIQTYIGNKWDSMKSKVSSFASYISTQLGNAISKVRAGLDTLGGAFSGLGGIISSAIGGLGMASISDMTIGLAMNRERMTALTSATMGGADAGQKFVDVMDNLTNSSLVSLDDLGQAMSTIKMSTGMSNAELEKFTTTVNDVGQRAILMGKSGDEAMALMQAAGRGLNGEFDMLKTNFGITKEQLQNLGWSGAADDVEGYQAALDKALEKGGSMNGMMDTSVGHLETLKKNFRIAGRHVGEMFTPYIDQAVQKLNGLNDTCPGLFENLVMIAGAISGFATIAPTLSPMLSAFDMLAGKTKAALVFFGLLEAEEGALTASGLAASASQTMLSIAEAAGADAAVIATAANSGLAASFWAMTAAILANPLTWVVVALIAIAVAIYEVGKAFGWWTDVQSMLAAVWSGIQRLWSAFINHPDVQAVIQAIGAAWNGLISSLQPVISWLQWAWTQIFPPGSKFDVVHSLIMGLGAVWEYYKSEITSVVMIMQLLWNALSSFYTSTLAPLGAYIMGILAPAFSWLSSLWGTLVEAVQPIVTVFQQFQDGQVGLLDVITTVASTLWNVWIILSSNLSNLILTLVGNLLTWAIQGGLNFLTGLLTYLSQLPGRVAIFLAQVLSRIISYGARWVAQGRQKASLLLNAIIAYLRQLPGKALSALLGVVSSIVSAGSQWISNAKNKAKAVVDGVRNTLSNTASAVASALNGVKNAVVKPFQDAYNQAKSWWDKIANLGNSAAGFDFTWTPPSAAGFELGDVNVGAGNVSTSSSSVQKLEVEANLTHDFRNLPNGVTAEEVARIVQDSTTDDSFVKKLANNITFQREDSKVKAVLTAKNNRAKGI